MLALLEDHHRAIADLCRRHRVKRLELFGSAARVERFTADSDIDFLVEFLDYDAPDIADLWFGLQEDLERLLGRGVDLTSPRTIVNPIFRVAADRDKVTVYAA